MILYCFLISISLAHSLINTFITHEEMLTVKGKDNDFTFQHMEYLEYVFVPFYGWVYLFAVEGNADPSLEMGTPSETLVL